VRDAAQKFLCNLGFISKIQYENSFRAKHIFIYLIEIIIQLVFKIEVGTGGT